MEITGHARDTRLQNPVGRVGVRPFEFSRRLAVKVWGCVGLEQDARH